MFGVDQPHFFGFLVDAHPLAINEDAFLNITEVHPIIHNKNTVAERKLESRRKVFTISDKKAIFSLNFNVFQIVFAETHAKYGAIFSLAGTRNNWDIPWHCDIVGPIDERCYSDLSLQGHSR